MASQINANSINTNSPHTVFLDGGTLLEKPGDSQAEFLSLGRIVLTL